MALSFGFYDSLNGDRKYNMEQISGIFDGIINDGVYASIGTSFVVQSAAGMGITVGIGRAWFNHTWTNNDTPLPLVVEPSEVIGDRIDTVVIEVNADIGARENAIKIIKGEPSSTPVPPVLLNENDVYQHPLCNISVRSGVSSITQQDITNLVGTAACPFVTGVVQTMTVEGITLLLEERFELWFSTVQNALTGDTAGNLLNMIQKSSYLQDTNPVNNPEPHSIWFDIQ